MSLLLFQILIGVFVLIFLLLGFKLILKSGWLLAWFRGTGGIVCLAIVVLLILTIAELSNYQEIPGDGAIAQVSVKEKSSQNFSLIVTLSEFDSEEYDVSGDLWQVSARVIKWNKLLKKLTLPDLYLVDNVSSRYITIEQELKLGKTEHKLHSPMVDIWSFFRFLDWIGILQSEQQNLDFVPMVGGGLFSVLVEKSELSLDGLNEPAKDIVKQWR